MIARHIGIFSAGRITLAGLFSWASHYSASKYFIVVRMRGQSRRETDAISCTMLLYSHQSMAGSMLLLCNAFLMQ